METFVIGDIVTIMPEWLNSKETVVAEYVVVDVNYEMRRCYIEPLGCDLPIKPQELVSFDMITLVRESEAVTMIKDQQKAKHEEN